MVAKVEAKEIGFKHVIAAAAFSTRNVHSQKRCNALFLLKQRDLDVAFEVWGTLS
jgi:hypothetical protein